MSLFANAAAFVWPTHVSGSANAPQDGTLPVITCPSDTLLTMAPFTCYAPLSYNVTVSDDQPGWTLTQTAGLPSPSAFPLGLTVNEFLVTDVEGNSASCSFTVTVKDYVAPVAACDISTIVTISPFDDPNDCYDGGVVEVLAAAFDDGSYDNCAGNLLFTMQRPPPYSNCINALNATNGHPNCNDVFPDFPSEFERAVAERDTIKFYCCEAGTVQEIVFRAYQLNPDQSISYGPGNIPIFSECIVTVQVIMSSNSCEDTTVVVRGQITLDADSDCQPDIAQAPIPGLIAKLTDSIGEIHYASSDANGFYNISGPSQGTASLQIIAPPLLWEVCNNPVTLSVPTAPADVVQDFQAKPVADCPLLRLDLASGLVRPCSTSIWAVSYCNIGGAVAQGAYVELVSDAHITLVSASQPFFFIGDTMRVQVGDVAVGECGNLWVVAEADCDANIIGERVCVEARIFPDTSCLPPAAGWSGAQIVVNGSCEGDSVRFTLRNVGTAPTAEILDYVIIDDMVIMREGQLPAGMPIDGFVEEMVHVSGDAVRVNAEQEPGHPVAQAPSVGIENCNGTTSPSLLLEFRNEDGDPFSDIACREVVGSFDPNEKLAFPRGYSSEHFIEQNTPISYQLNFQNTGNDTAFLVVLRDTLSPLLDPGTIRVGAGSHPYTWTLEGPGYLTVRFANILLPDSTTNEPASHGFVKFNIAQKKDNPLGSVIENRAGIYFDINPVVLTNTVFHTIGKDFLITAADEPETTGNLKVYPNPATESMYVPLENDAQVRLSDMFGRTLRTWQGKAPGLTIQRDGLPEGIYLLEARPAKGKMQAGKVVWRNKQ